MKAQVPANSAWTAASLRNYKLNMVILSVEKAAPKRPFKETLSRPRLIHSEHKLIA